MTADGLFEPTSIPGHLAPTPERLERLLSKQTLEELYEVEEQPFARGKYATVRRCRERSSGRQWAAKFLRKSRRAQVLRAEALHEVAVLDAAANCSRLVSLHQVFETNTEMILVLELAPGGELQMILDRDEIPEERQVARLLKQILNGIAFLHSLNVAHLDIKPQNLVLTGEFPDCDVKLCDFGMSRYISQGADLREILGTPEYVAPEVLNYEPISLATDMWSVGVLLYVLLTGCSPFGGDTKQETFCNVSRCRLDFPDDLFEDVTEEARDLMRKLVVKDPSERLTVTECLQHPWFALFDDPVGTLSLGQPIVEDVNTSVTPMQQLDCSDNCTTITTTVTVTENVVITKKNYHEKTEENSKSVSTKCQDYCHEKSENTVNHNNNVNNRTTTIASSYHNDTSYSRSKSIHKSLELGLSPDRRDTFKRNMNSLAQKFSSTEMLESTTGILMEASDNNCDGESTTSSRIQIVTTTQQRRATASHTMPTSGGEVFKCTPVFILGSEEQHCSDGGSDTVSEISTDSSSDRSSIYSDDSLDFILYGKTQGGGRASFPFPSLGVEHPDRHGDRWTDQRPHRRVWPRECNGVVSKALSRFTNPESNNPKLGKLGLAASSSAVAIRANKTGLEALRERGGNLVVIREPVRAGRYTRYSEVQCESVQARIRRFQVHGTS